MGRTVLPYSHVLEKEIWKLFRKALSKEDQAAAEKVDAAIALVPARTSAAPTGTSTASDQDGRNSAFTGFPLIPAPVSPGYRAPVPDSMPCMTYDSSVKVRPWEFGSSPM